MVGHKIALGKGWRMKDGKPVKTGKGKSVSQKIAEAKKPKRKWGKAMKCIALATACFAAMATPEAPADAAKRICNTWTHDCWWENDDGQVIKRPRKHVHKRKATPQVRAYVKRDDDHDGVSCKPRVRVVGDARPSESGAKDDAEAAWMRETRWKYGALYLSLPNAKDYQIRCGRDSITEIVGQVMVRCELMAQPCNPPFESK